MNQIKNVEESFAEWLQKTIPDSYRQYLGRSVSQTIERLREINEFFPERNIFVIENGNPEVVINFIKHKTHRKERVNNPDFVKYDNFHSNGIPKAVIGKSHYFRFLEQYFAAPMNYWIFQGNPNVFDFETAVREELLTDWTVSAHKDKIKPGDKAILWITGDQSGCYALADITSEPHPRTSSPDDHLWKETNKNELKAGIRITENLSKEPILKKDLDGIKELADLKVGHQGTNFSATREEYNGLLKIIASRKNLILEGENEFRDIIQTQDKQDVLNFFEFMDTVIERFNIQTDDERVVTGTSKKQLNLTIRQRYCWNLYPPNTTKGKFGLISAEPIVGNHELFKGNGPKAFYSQFDDYMLALEHQDNALSSIERELARKHKSSYSQFNNVAFRKAIFDKDYRNKILNTSEFNINTSMEMKENRQRFPLNQILYGPPGTGKTYQLQDKYFNRFTIRESSLSRKQFLLNTIVDKTWWQVLSMAVLDLGNSSVDEIMTHELVLTKMALGDSKLPRNTIWGTLQGHALMECPNVGVKDRSNVQLFWKDENSHWKVIKESLEEQYPDAISILNSIKNYTPDSATLIKNYEFVTFHQSFSYEDFVEGIKPRMDEEDSELDYEIADGVFKRLALRAKADPDNDYAIFIDEINRGNVSAIFGELITLLEEDKRSEGKNPLSVKLPYSKTEFDVPSNLYVFGTMNTADRSVEALDTALRRRFSFKEIMPKPSLLRELTFETFNLEEVLTTINERVEFLLDRDHTIGHSYFMNVKSGDVEALEEVFKNKVIPLLQEYFYHDYEKIALILGSGFVVVKTNHAIKFPIFEGISEPDNVTLCTLIENIEDIEKAVNLLLNRHAS